MSIHHPLLISTLGAVLLLTACNQSTPVGRPMQTTGNTVAKINGVSITDTELDLIVKTRLDAGQSVTKEAVLDEIIGLELLRQTAVADGLHKKTEIATEINRQATNVLASAYIRNLLQTQPVTEDDVQKTYQEQVAAFPKQEYKARHILSVSKEDALANIEALKKNTDFAELAKQKSTGPSGPRGGDLGWANPNSFVPEFSKALQALEKGKYTEEPVETQFGWHVILLEDIRDTQLPEINALRSQLERMVINNRLKELIAGLREKANVTISLQEEEAAAEDNQESAADESSSG